MRGEKVKIGVACPVCQCDSWIMRKGKARCGICFPSKVNTKREWPRMVKIWHHEFIRKDGTGKPPVMCAHRITFSDYELERCLAAIVEKVKMPGGVWQYRVTPVMKYEYKNFDVAKSDFSRKKIST